MSRETNFCEIDGFRYTKDAILTNFPETIN